MHDGLEPDVFWRRLQTALGGVEEKDRTPPPEARAGAVLVLLEQTEAGPGVILTRRRRDLRSHPGQVSFAGGRIDEGETVEEAALREAQEEIGLDAETVEVLGAGRRFYIPPSRFWVVPVVARWRHPHELDPNPWEVDAVLRVPIATLLEEERWRKVPLSLRGASWAWQLDDDVLWGATAIVVALMLDVAVPGWAGGRDPEELPEDRALHPWEDAPSWQRRPRLSGDLPAVAQADLPHVTSAQMRRVDELLASAGLGLGSLVEQAGRALVSTVRLLVDAPLDGLGVTVLAGSGGNGAGGLAAARLLDAAGAEAEVVVTGTPAVPWQLDVLARFGIPWQRLDDGVPASWRPREVVVDALLGYGGRPPLHGMPRALAEWLQHHDVPVVALDLPSGIGADEGLAGLCVAADVTVTLAAPKVGLAEAIVRPYVGDLYLADIGVPRAAWEAVGVGPVEVFGSGPLVRLLPAEAASDAGTPDQARIPDADG